SLFDLICVFYPEFREARQISEWICNRKVLYILDGLDEYKKVLDFKNRLLSDVTEETSVDVLLVNLLRGRLLPSAHVWITSRPVAAGQLPSEVFRKGCITHIRGFTDEQKQEYFKRQFENTKLTKEVICHLKSQKSLWILCHIPLFCWISSVVLKDITENQNKDRNTPSNLTEMYIHYLLIQTGLSHKKYQGVELKILEGFLPSVWRSSSDDHRKVATYIKSLRRKDLSSERCIGLVRCLVELKNRSLLQEMHELERSQSKEPLTPFQSTLLAFQFVMSDTKHDEFDLRKYNISLDGFQRFSPAITCFRKALLKGSGFTEQHCEILTRYLSSPHSHLTHLDLSHNALGLSALEQLSTALRDPNSQTEILNLSHNNFQSQDMEQIRDVLSGENMNLRVLDLSDNPLQDPGVEILSDGLQSPNCHLEVLKLSGCQIKGGVYQLMSSLKVNSSYLRELDLRYNDLGNIGQEILQHGLPSLSISTGGECGHQPGLDKYFVALTFDPQTANEHLYLSENNTKVTRQKEKQQLPANGKRFDMCNQVLSCQPLIGRRFFTVDVIGPDVYVGVACKRMERKGASNAVCLGQNKMSWSLRLSDNLCVAHHYNETVSVQSESVRKLGVFVDRDAGSVCFYMLSPQYKLLYMFDADFPQDQELYAAFRIQEPNSSAVLMQETQ
uniref:B30.2/SPRY domain-containing protein n=1 Tax=Cyprinus carpio TaxID=7962 RepID=A0A8C1NXR0_CYPCA